VAYQWRIRHKLMLGLGLVVGIIAILLAGTLNGLLSYSSTVKSIDSKVQEEIKAVELKNAVNLLAMPERTEATEEEDSARVEATEREDRKLVRRPPDEGREQLLLRIDGAKKALAEYRNQLQDTLNRRRDPDKGENEKGTLERLDEYFDQLEKAIDLESEKSRVTHDTLPLLAGRPEIKAIIKRLVGASNDLPQVIYDNIKDRMTEAKRCYRNSMIIVIATSALGVVLMSGLLRFFYRWVFYPVRDLELGANRVAQGDFEHRIDVHSGDEMEDLARAFNDMTGRLRETYRNLAHQVNERSRQLVRSERLASVGFLAAGVAHEINNPLASIAFCSEALESRLADILDHLPVGNGEVITKYLKMIQQEAFRCKAITQRLLEFSRSSERRREFTDLAELVQSVLDMVQHLQNSKGKQILFEPAGPILAWINAQEIKSVVLNLVVNALDSMDEDGALTITLGQRDRMAELVFTDTGCGMSQEVLENIFEPFFTRSRTGKGTGLGLAISHRVITQHGGEIEASSLGLNQGSSFTVRLPMQPAEEQGLGARDQGSGVRDSELGSANEGLADRARKAA
jgi:signal transduction histidine kinase